MPTVSDAEQMDIDHKLLAGSVSPRFASHIEDDVIEELRAGYSIDAVFRNTLSMLAMYFYDSRKAQGDDSDTTFSSVTDFGGLLNVAARCHVYATTAAMILNAVSPRAKPRLRAGTALHIFPALAIEPGHKLGKTDPGLFAVGYSTFDTPANNYDAASVLLNKGLLPEYHAWVEFDGPKGDVYVLDVATTSFPLRFAMMAAEMGIVSEAFTWKLPHVYRLKNVSDSVTREVMLSKRHCYMASKVISDMLAFLLLFNKTDPPTMHPRILDMLRSYEPALKQADDFAENGFVDLADRLNWPAHYPPLRDTTLFAPACQIYEAWKKLT